MPTAVHSSDVDRTWISPTQLIELRDVLLHRILSAVDAGPEADGEIGANEDNFSSSPGSASPSAIVEECLRLTALVLTLDRLFLPVLPSAYALMVRDAVIGDRLCAILPGPSDWANLGDEVGLAVLLWVCLVGLAAAVRVHYDDADRGMGAEEEERRRRKEQEGRKPRTRALQLPLFLRSHSIAVCERLFPGHGQTHWNEDEIRDCLVGALGEPLVKCYFGDDGDGGDAENGLSFFVRFLQEDHEGRNDGDQRLKV